MVGLTHFKNTTKPKPLVKESVTATLIVYDIIALCLAFMLALFSAKFFRDILLDDWHNAPLSSYTQLKDMFFVWMCPIVLFLFFAKGHYTQRIPWWNQVQTILVVCFLALIVDGFIRFVLDMPFSRLLITFSWGYAFFFILLGRQIVYMVTRGKGIWGMPTVVIGDQDIVGDVLYAFATDPYTGYRVETICIQDKKRDEFDATLIPPQYRETEVVTRKLDYCKYVKQNPEKFFIISFEHIRGKDRDELIKTLTTHNVRFAVLPPVSRLSLFEMEPRYFFGYDIMLLHTKKTLLSPIGRFLKRSMDIVVASTALLLLTPIMLLVSIMLKVEGQSGSVFYGGYRVGKYGDKFRCWKFQSMEPNSDHLLHELLERDPEAKADWEKYRKLKQPDPRVTTKTARIIRKTSIDELPQLWNVIKGDMSLVGPRPILEDEMELFGDAIIQYTQVRPGITGLWQVSGRNETSFERRIYWDSWYVRNWSFWGDIVIMIKTLRVVLGGSGAY